MTSVLLFTPLIVFGTSTACLVPILAKLIRPLHIEDVPPDWLENFSVSAYRPMEGLLNSEDFSFLSRQPGFDLALYKKLRYERLRIFQQYLNRLILDFNRLHVVARFLVATSDGDHSDALKRLIWLKVRFSAAVLQAQTNYMLCRIGLKTLPVQGVLLVLEEMNSRLNQIHSQQSPLAA